MKNKNVDTLAPIPEAKLPSVEEIDIGFNTDNINLNLERTINAFKDNRPVTNDKVRDVSVSPFLDSEWVSSAFMVASEDLDELDATNRYWSSANFKFTDTRPGGNIGINPKPQFTPYSDIRIRGRLSGRSPVTLGTRGNYGLGQYYSEAIDDHEQVVFMEFGVPEHNSFTRFFSLAIDPNAAFTANTGRASIFRKIGELAGNVLMLTTFPVASILIWTTKLATRLIPASSSKYYYLKPTMYLYWSMVNSLFTSTMVELGIFPASLTDNNANQLGLPRKTNETQMSILQSLMPDVFSGDNYIDMFAIANRTQVLSQEQEEREFKLFESGSEVQWEGYLKETNDPTIVPPNRGEHSFGNFVNQLVSFSSDIGVGYLIDELKHKTNVDVPIGKDGQGNPIKKKADIVATTEVNNNVGDKPEINHKAGDKSWWSVSKDWFSGVGKYFDAQVRQGASFARFYVEYTGTVTESFSSSVKDPAIKSVLNSISGSSRDVKFNLSGGDIGFGPIGDVLKFGTEAITQFISGGLSSVTFGLSNVISALLGGGYIDVPKQWEDSSVSLPKITYNMKLVTPYGNDISLMHNIYMPLCMMLAGALPIATGKASYTSPFLCSIYDRGKQYVKLGIIDSLSITRGTTNLGFTKDGKPLGVDISFSVLDLSSIMAVPISDGGIFGLDLTLDEDHLLPTYLGVITGRSLYSQRYISTRAKYRLAKKMFDVKSAFSPARMGMLAGDSIVGNILSVFVNKSQIIPR